MPTPRNPLPNTGPYTPPVFVNPGRTHVLGAPGQQLEGEVLPRDAGRATPGDEASLVDILRLLYPIHADRAPDRFDVGRGFVNNRPVADRQALTMAASQHPLGDAVGPYDPPGEVTRYRTGEYPVQRSELVGPRATQREPADLISILRLLYPPSLFNPNDRVGPDDVGHLIANSQAIGDRPVTTMTNPLPNYSPLTMVKGQAAAQLRTLINHALAQRSLSPLVNTPLPVGAAQMGMAR